MNKEQNADRQQIYKFIMATGGQTPSTSGDQDSVSAVVDTKGMERCQEHNNIIAYFCQNHSKLCCSECLFTHMKCGENVVKISNVSGEKGQDPEVLGKLLKQMKFYSDAIVAQYTHSESELDVSIGRISKELDDMKTYILQLFEEAKRNVITAANVFKVREVQRLAKTKTPALKLNTEIHEILPTYSDILQHGTPQQMFIVSKKIEEKHKLVENLEGTQVPATMSLSFSSELSALIEMKNEIIKLNTKQHSTLTEDSENSSDIFEPSRPFNLKQLVSINLIPAGKDEMEPLVTGLDFLPDGRLVAVDHCNWKCFILNDQLQTMGTPFKFKSKPFYVVCLSCNELAVTLGYKTVCFLSVHSDYSFSLIRTIKTSSNVNSICCMESSKLVVSTVEHTRPVIMISMEGIESEFDNVTFPKMTYKAGESYCTYVQSTNTLVLTDRGANKVYMYDTVKGTSTTVTDDNIQGPRGACVGPGDTTVLVCSRKTNSIAHLTSDGGVLDTYTVDLVYPFTLCMSKDGRQLALTNSSQGDKKLCLYMVSPI